MKKADILARLSAFPYDLRSFWIITGAAMVLYGLREETGDIDMGCTQEAADRLEADGYFVGKTPDGKRKFRIGDDMEIYENWLCGEIVPLEGVFALSLEGLREMKAQLGREKDLRDIARIDAFLAASQGDGT